METSAKGIKKALIYLLDQIIESKALYNSISSIEINDKFHLDSKSSKEESFVKNFVKNVVFFKRSKEKIIYFR